MNERLMEAMAARLEYRQADRDFKEAFEEWDIDRPWDAQDVSVWSTSAYADAAQAVLLSNPPKRCDYCYEYAVEIQQADSVFGNRYCCVNHI